MNIASAAGSARQRPNVKLPQEVPTVSETAPKTPAEIIAWLRAELPPKDTAPVDDDHDRGMKTGWNSALERVAIAVNKLERLLG